MSSSGFTPDFSIAQAYMASPPSGMGLIDVPGWYLLARDVGVAVVDSSWEENHEDLIWLKHGIDAVGSAGVNTRHGTATLGVLAAERGKYHRGLVGMAPAARYVFSRHAAGSSLVHALHEAVLRLGYGDVLLVERQLRNGNNVEYDWGVRTLIHDAVRNRGIHVVLPAANGDHDLDPPAYHGLFGRSNETGATFVGAGEAPRPSASPVRPRSWMKGNYGERLDVQGWGRDVVTADWSERLFPYPGTASALRDYALSFNWTSAASAVVTGVVAIAVGFVRRITGGSNLHPLALRPRMVNTGSPQVCAWGEQVPSKRIGPQPDLPALVRCLRSDIVGWLHVPVNLPSPLAAGQSDLIRLRGFGLTRDEALGILNPGSIGAHSLAQVHDGLDQTLMPGAGLAGPIEWATAAEHLGLT